MLSDEKPERHTKNASIVVYIYAFSGHERIEKPSDQ